MTAQTGYQSAALSALFTPQAVFYNVAAGLAQPIFDGFRIQSNFELQKARQDELIQTLSEDGGLVLCRREQRARCDPAVERAAARAEPGGCELPGGHLSWRNKGFWPAPRTRQLC